MLAVVLSFVPGSCEWLYSTRKGFITLILVFLVFFVGINYFCDGYTCWSKLRCTESGRQSEVFVEEWMFCFLRWMHLSIDGGIFAGMNDEFVFAMNTPVDSWWGFRRDEWWVCFCDGYTCRSKLFIFLIDLFWGLLFAARVESREW